MAQTRRRVLIVAAATWPLAQRSSRAQQAPRVWRIGVVTTRPRPADLEADFLGAWIPRLRELGYVEGRDFTVEWRFADGDNARLPDLAAELVQARPDLILAAGTPAEVAEAVVWLCSGAASFTTGHIFPIDGGVMAG